MDGNAAEICLDYKRLRKGDKLLAGRYKRSVTTLMSPSFPFLGCLIGIRKQSRSLLKKKKKRKIFVTQSWEPAVGSACIDAMNCMISSSFHKYRSCQSDVIKQKSEFPSQERYLSTCLGRTA